MDQTYDYMHVENAETNTRGHESYYNDPLTTVTPQLQPVMYTDLLPPQHEQSMNINTPPGYTPRSEFENYVIRDLENVKQMVDYSGRRHFENEVLKRLDNLTSIVENIKKDLSNEKDARKKLKEKKRDVNVFQRPSGFPMNTIEEFDKFEKADPSEHNALKRHLEFLGGCNVRDALHRFFQATMTPTLATNFTWTGKTKGNVEGKRILYKTKLVSIFFDTVKKNSNINQLTSDEWRSSCQAVLKSHKQVILNMRNAAKKRTDSKKSRRNRREEENLLFPNVENPQPGPSTIADSETDSSDDNLESEL